jgi:hypothetical protein
MLAFENALQGPHLLPLLQPKAESKDAAQGKVGVGAV